MSDRITSHLPLARSLANRYSHRIDHDEAFSAAMQGLIDAEASYRPGNQSFGSYAKVCCRNRIKHILTRQHTQRRGAGCIHIPIHHSSVMDTLSEDCSLGSYQVSAGNRLSISQVKRAKARLCPVCDTPGGRVMKVRNGMREMKCGCGARWKAE